MARANDPVVARSRRRRRPGGGSSSGLWPLASVNPLSLHVRPTAPKRGQRLFVEQKLRLAASGRALSALTTTSARAQSSSNAKLSRTMESDLPSGRAATAAKAVAGRVEGACSGRIAPVAVRRQPLLGSKGVEALADHLERTISASRTAARSCRMARRRRHSAALCRAGTIPDERERIPAPAS